MSQYQGELDQYRSTNPLGFRSWVGRYVYPRSRALLPVWRYFLLFPMVFAFHFHVRRIWFWLTGHGLRQLSSGAEVQSAFVRLKSLPYNLANQFVINRDRTERLISVLCSIRDFRTSKAQILVVGPRNEAELLLLRFYGLSARNIEAIDLFTYAPTIKLMDMHNLDYPDDKFDCYYSAFVITYSDDIRHAVEEAIRVSRDGAMMVFAFEALKENVKNRLGVRHLGGGIDELCDLFGDHVDEVYWRERFELENSFHSSLIFRLKKPAKSA